MIVYGCSKASDGRNAHRAVHSFELAARASPAAAVAGCSCSKTLQDGRASRCQVCCLVLMMWRL